VDARYRFGNFLLNHARGCLQGRDGTELFLRPKSFLLLTVLIDRAGALVSKDELAEAVWPEVIVSDDSVAHCVSDIRKALGEDGARHIRTVPRRGYMFLPEVDTPARLPPRLAAAWRRYAGAAAAAVVLCAAAIIGTVDKTPRPAPSPALTAAESQRNVAVETAVMRANNLLDERDWTRRSDNEAARAMLEAAVAADPDHAGAWAGLGLTYWQEVQHLSWAGGRREMRQALAMVERSVRLGAGPRAYRLLAEMRLLAPFEDMRNPLDALAVARSAVELDPDDPDSLAVLAEVLSLTGQADEAVGLIERARRLNPNYPSWYSRRAGMAYLFAGEPGRAVEELTPLYDAGGLAHARSWPGWLLAASLAHSGREAEAATVIEAARRRMPGTSMLSVASSLDGFDLLQSREVVLDGLRLAGMPG
jgi:DNA-binding winged helix-turn-helix (wHTH) protein/Tfp pilus assembly protein PilF